jgi:hypothetical protein
MIQNLAPWPAEAVVLALEALGELVVIENLTIVTACLTARKST